jgi:hypothetical protein
MYYVYSIGSSSNINECYVGVTNNLIRRWKGHVKSGYSVSKAIQENAWTYENNMKVLFEGSEEECFKLEETFRPFPNIGLNEAKGGHGGYTKYDEERNAKISQKLKGRTVTWGDKISESKKASGNIKGKNNPRAKTWKLISPSGIEHVLHGNFFEFCEQNELSSNTLYNNVGQTIGALSSKFRDKGDVKIRQRRINTIGWILYVGD